MTTASLAKGLPAGTVDVALAWRDVASALLGARISEDPAVLRDLLLPLLVEPDPPAPVEPVAVNGGWVQADLIADDVEVFERLRASLPEAGPEELSAAAQEWRLPVLPYRSEPWAIDSGSTGRPGASGAPLPRFGGSLEGVNVLDLTAMWAGPLATRLLADAGASVTKVDPDCRPDGFRVNAPLYEELNSGKDIIDLDLRVATDRTAFERRVAEADLLIESFSRRVMPNLGHGQRELRSLNPAITTISIVGFPLGCAEQDWLAYGTGIHAISGLGLTTDRAEPAPVGYPDPVTAYAMFARALEVLGSGRHSEVALIDSAAAIHPLSGNPAADQGGTRREPARVDNQPADVRIEDLLDPILPEGAGEALDAMDAEAEKLDWSPEAIRRAAVEATGVDDFGDGLMHDGLNLLSEIGSTSTALRGSGRVSLWNSLVHNATQRLLIVEYLDRHPEVHDIEIERPIVIAGQARTGTTHLHNLLAADPVLRSLQYWESVEPVPPLSEQGRTFAVDPRYARAKGQLAGLNHVLPYFKRIHDMYAAHVHEEIELMKPALGSMLWETTLCDERFRDAYLAADQTPYYRWLRTVLQVCTHLGGGGRWVLKSPQHVEQIGPLLSVFPDAIVLCTHRDPVAVTKSVSTMIAYTSRTSKRPECLRDVGRYWIDRMETMFAGYVTGRDLVPDGQGMDVMFEDFMADDVAMIRRIYEFAGQPFTPEVSAAMNSFMAEHPRGKHGRVIYDLADFGYDADERHQALSFYTDRFDVPIE